MSAKPDLSVVPLRDVLDFQEGPGIMARDFRDDGVPLIRLAGLRQQGTLLAGCNYLDPEMVEGRWKHFRLKAGDVLLSTSASLGEVAVVDDQGEGAIAYTGIIRFRPRDDRILPEFIPHALTSPSFARQIEAMGAGSVLRHFGPLHLKQMTITLPSRAEQSAIAEILEPLDSKINCNRRLIQRCELLAQALPEGLPAKATVSAIAAIRRQMVPPRSFAGGLVEHFSIPAFDDAALPVLEPGASIKSAKFALPGPAVLVSKLNPHIPRVWMAVPRPDCLALTSTEFVVLEPKAGYDIEVLWALCSRPVFSNQLREMVKGTTGSHQRVAPEDILRIEVPHPKDLQPRTVTSIISFVRLATALKRESATLAATRTALLPKLLNGELRIRDTEALVG